MQVYTRNNHISILYLLPKRERISVLWRKQTKRAPDCGNSPDRWLVEDADLKTGGLGENSCISSGDISLLLTFYSSICYPGQSTCKYRQVLILFRKTHTHTHRKRDREREIDKCIKILLFGVL